MLSDAQGIPLAVAVSGANMHDGRGPASSPANASVGTAGRSNGRSPGSSATAASPSDSERKGSHFLVILGLAAALTSYQKLAKRAT